jgi:hypothetical protein
MTLHPSTGSKFTKATDTHTHHNTSQLFFLTDYDKYSRPQPEMTTVDNQRNANTMDRLQIQNTVEDVNDYPES